MNSTRKSGLALCLSVRGPSDVRLATYSTKISCLFGLIDFNHFAGDYSGRVQANVLMPLPSLRL